MSAVGKGAPVHTDAPRVVSLPQPRGPALDEREWVDLVDQHLPAMWHLVSGYDAPDQLRHEACTIAWLRLAQRGEKLPDQHTETWLVMTARIELERALARSSVSL